MDATTTNPAIFVTFAQTSSEWSNARVLAASIRSFGGFLSRCPIWLFADRREPDHEKNLEGLDVRCWPLRIPDSISGYYFAAKVSCCAKAEEMAAQQTSSLVWIDPGCLIVQPPSLFHLGNSVDAAIRPVQVKNVGLSPAEPPDAFWGKIFQTAGVADVSFSIETFMEGERIRAYFNSHAFAIDPAIGLLRRWVDDFVTLVSDNAFQSSACQDELHKVFLHQAVLSALLAVNLTPKRIRILPPEYNYPYHLHQSLPNHLRVSTLNDLVCVAREGDSLDPDRMKDIDIRDPLRSWLSAIIAANPSLE